MDRKLFSKVYDERVKLAPGVKRIPAEDFTQMQSVEEVLNEAQEIRERVKEEAKAYRQQVASECEKEKEAAQQEGFKVGLELWSAQLLHMEKKLAAAEEEMKRLVVPVALKAARKIVGREIELSEETVVDIIETNLRAVASHEYVTVWVNKNNLDVLNQNKDKLKNVFDRLQTLTIMEREDVSPGSCVIETEQGIINAEIENQWDHLENTLLRMMEETPPVV